MIGEVTPLEARQIANLISRRAKVKIKEGKGWAYNFKDKVITYRPADLIVLTEIEVVGNLLHEVGHALYSKKPTLLDFGKVKKEHWKAVKELVNLIEDFRVEDKTRKRFPYATEYLPLYSFKTYFILKEHEKKFRTGKIPLFFQYMFALYGYIANIPVEGTSPKVVKALKATGDFGVKARFTQNTQELADIVCKKIYPHIKKFILPEREPIKLGSICFSSKPPKPVYKNPYSSIKSLIEPTTRELGKVLNAKSFSKLTGRFRTGKRLSKRRLYRARLNEFNLFERKQEAELKNYVVALVVDESGSMTRGSYRDERIKEAIKAAMLFSCVLAKLKIPFSLHGFNQHIKHYKLPEDSFNVKSKKDAYIFEKMFRAVYTKPDANDNNDGWAVYQVAQRLLSYSQRKIMFVISDGLPAPWGEGMDYDLEEQIKLAQKKGIDVIGLGISQGMGSSLSGLGSEMRVHDWYSLHICVPDVSELPKVLVKELKAKLIK